MEKNLVTTDQSKKEIVTAKELQSKLKQHQNKLSHNKKYIKEGSKVGLKAVEKIEKVFNKHIINVNLEIPKDFVKKLGEEKVYRIGGALRIRENKRFAKHLSEVSPSNVKKLAKFGNVAFLALDLIESAVVDQKLKEILIYVKDIDLKLDAQNRGELKSAIEQIKELQLIQNEEVKKQKILFIQDRLSYCEQLFTEIYDGRWQKYVELNRKYQDSRITNYTELKELTRIGKSLPNDLDPIVLCKVAQTKLCEMQGEFILAKEKAFNLNSFVADKLDEYKDAFSSNSLSIQKEKYKRCGFQKRNKRFIAVEEELEESNEKIEFLLNYSICYTLSIPEELDEEVDSIVSSEVLKKDDSLFTKIKKWFIAIFKKLKRLFNKSSYGRGQGDGYF